jgi:hypothetical protein
LRDKSFNISFSGAVQLLFHPLVFQVHSVFFEKIESTISSKNHFFCESPVLFSLGLVVVCVVVGVHAAFPFLPHRAANESKILSKNHCLPSASACGKTISGYPPPDTKSE